MLAGIALAAALAGSPYPVLDELDRMASRPLWPGFDPAGIPAAYFDGSKTVLYRHPDVPEGFHSISARIHTSIREGRHPAVTANSSAEIGGQTAATALFDAAAMREPRRAAAVLLHEAFHVWAASRHPDWTANEMDFFTYPTDSAESAALAALEMSRLFEAAGAAKAARARCAAAAAERLRRERFAGLSESARAYERGLELKEGLASYVQGRALGRPAARRSGFPAWMVRDRVYATGEAMALLLDRLDGDWKRRLDASPGPALDELLAGAVGEKVSRACDPGPRERAEALAQARRDAEALNAQRRSEKDRFLSAPGWRLEIAAGPEVFWPQGFDPLNIRSLGGGEALHTRWVKIGNDRGAVEVLDRSALTEGAGDHPILKGIRRLVVTGLPEPRIEERPGVLRIEADGVTGELRGARWARDGNAVRVWIAD
jgi:hypothetical protein